MLIVTTWFLSLLAAAFITARLVEDADEFSHAEQEEIKAALRRIEERRGRDRLLLPTTPPPLKRDHARSAGYPQTFRPWITRLCA